MIGTLLRVGLLSLRRDRVALAMSFLLPIAFFSIFALVFGGRAGSTPSVDVALVDEDSSELSGRLATGLAAEKGLSVSASRSEKDGRQVPLDAAAARELVRGGQADVAVVFPPGFGDSFPSLGGDGPAVQVLADPANPIAPQMVAGLLQKVAFTAAPDLLAGRGMQAFESSAGAFTPEQKRQVDGWLESLRQPAPAGDGGGDSGAFSGLVRTEVVDVIRQTAPRKGIISFYAAGIGVMFLLFSAAGGGGSLLDESESGTLDRLLSSGLGMNRLLAGKWLFLVIQGMAELTVMFLWGALVFGLDLFTHLPGFLVMTAVSAAAAGGFGLVLATACRSRAQLGGTSTIVILIMSAVGGSMFPRFLMSESMQRLGLLTFNGWALDGYLKVFWRDEPLLELWPQVTVLLALTAVFLGVARLLARRWETV